MQGHQMRHNPNLSVRKMFCIPTERVYKDVYQRSFSLGLTPRDTNNLQNFFEKQGVGVNQHVNMISAAKEIGGIVRMSHTPSGKVVIPHGWDTRRLIFMLEVDEVLNNSTMLTHYLQGYSEYYDPTHTGRLDPNESYFINSITTVIRTKSLHNNQVSSRVLSTYNLISDHAGNLSFQQVQNPEQHIDLIRPSDIMMNLHTNNLYGGNDGLTLNVVSGSISNGANVSTRANSDPLKYFTKTVNSVISGKSAENIGYNTPEMVLSTACGAVAEEAITANEFMCALARVSGIMEPGSFTLTQLERIDPGISSKITLVNSGSLIRESNNMANLSLDTRDTEGWLNYSEHGEVAQTFINALTTAMSENLITIASGMVTNTHGTPLTTISSINSFLEGIDITPYGNRMVNYVNDVIMPRVTMNGMRLVNIVFDCDLMGDTTVSVAIDDPNHAVIYRLPSFADGLFAPVITDSVNKQAVIGDFEVIADTIMTMDQNNGMGDMYAGHY